MSDKVVFLDRDGVINALVERHNKLVSPRMFRDFRILDGVSESINILRREKYEVVVVTNQPDISRGLMLQTELDQMTQVLWELEVDRVLICPHSDEDACLCRKPKPGLLNQYLQTVELVPAEIWMIGDSEVDMQAGREIGAQTILITTAEQTGGVIATAPNLLSATLSIMKNRNKTTKHQN